MALALGLTSLPLISQYCLVITFRKDQKGQWALKSSDRLLKCQVLLPTTPTISRPLINLQYIQWETGRSHFIKSLKITIFTSLLPSSIKTNLYSNQKLKSSLVHPVVKTWLKLKELLLQTITWHKTNHLPNHWIPVVKLGLKKDNSR